MILLWIFVKSRHNLTPYVPKIDTGSYGRTQSGKGLQILKGSLFYFFYGCTLRKARKKDAIRESILEEKIQEIYSQNRR